MFAQRELAQLEKYVGGEIIQKEDKVLIENLQSMGLATSGFHQEGSEVYDTSRLTPEGYDLFKLSEINYNPLKRFFHALINSVY